MAKARAHSRRQGVRAQISIKKVDLSDDQARVNLREILSAVDKKLKPVTDAIRESQRLTKEDFSVRINSRG